MACYKKKQEDLVPTSFSSMKAAFCSSLLADALGHLRGKRQSSRILTAMTVFLPWRRSPYQPSTSAWDCMSDSSRRTSRPNMWRLLYEACCDTYVDISFCYGITARSTKGHSLLKSEPRIRAYTLSGSRHMRLNSIQWRKSGMTSSVIQPTAYPSTSKISESACTTIQGGHEVLRRSFARLFSRPTCHLLHGGDFHYLCEAL
jgi:hypothetical protein